VSVFDWAGASTGDWSSASNWTEDGAPATEPPGTDDQVTVNGDVTLTGAGQSAALTLDGPIVLAGNFTTQTLTTAQSVGISISINGATPPVAAVVIDAGASLTVTGDAGPPPPAPDFGFTIAQPLTPDIFDVDGDGARLSVGGVLTLQGGRQGLSDITSLAVTSGGQVEVGTLAMEYTQLSVDTASSLEVGDLGIAAAGSVTIDPGAEITVAGTGDEIFASNLIDNGVIETADLPSSELEIAAPVSGSGVLEISGDTGLNLDQADLGVTIRFGEPALFGGLQGLYNVGGSLELAQASLDPSGAFGAAIVGFGASDSISLAAAATSATWQDGLLTVRNGQTPVAELHLPGDYGGIGFTVTPEGATSLITADAAPAVENDFAGSGVSGILFGQGDGSLAIWEMNGTAIRGGGEIGAPGSTWAEVGTGDFTGAGRADILFQDAAHNLAIWEMNDTQIVGGGDIGAPGGTWSAVGVGDFTGGGLSDILFKDGSGNLAIWEMNGTEVAGGGNIGNPGGSWAEIGIGDFNGDGKADILFHDAAGDYAIWEMNGTQIIGGGVIGGPGGSWSFEGIGDFTGAGTSDILFKEASGDYAIWEMNGTAVVGGGDIGNPGGTWQFAGIGDYAGLGHDDILFTDAAGNLAIWEMNGASIVGGGEVGNPGAVWHVLG
jgi:hypothetical protein